MSKDGYMGKGEILLDPHTLRAVILELRNKNLEPAVIIVEKMYAELKAEIEKHIKHTKVHG